MKTISLVTGGAGFIGSHVAAHLLQEKHEVIILDDLSGGNIDNIPKEAIFYEGSITDVELVNSLFEKHQFTYVYHLAAYAAEGLSHFIRNFNYQNNLIGSINLINASVNHNIKCFVFTSSIAVYGAGSPPLSEEQHPLPEDPYAIAKYAVEQDLINAKAMFDLDYIIFRPHNVYGRHQNIGDKYRNVVGIFMNQILQKQPLTIFGDGQQSRAFTHINDVAPYIANSINIGKALNNVFNIGTDDVFTVKELATEVCLAMDAPVNIKQLAQRKEVLHAYSDHSKFDIIFSPSVKTLLKEGLREMATWVKHQGTRASNPFQNIEIHKQLPDSWKQV